MLEKVYFFPLYHQTCTYTGCIQRTGKHRLCSFPFDAFSVGYCTAEVVFRG